MFFLLALFLCYYFHEIHVSRIQTGLISDDESNFIQGLVQLQVYLYASNIYIKMKIIKNILRTLLIIYGTGLVSCDYSIENVSLDNVKCSCSEKMDFINENKLDSVLLLDSAKISFEEMCAVAKKGTDIVFISFNPVSENAFLFYDTEIDDNSPSYGRICNFPFDIVSGWDMTSDGVFIKVKVDVYESCFIDYPFSITSPCYDIVIKSFKKYIE